MGVDLEIEHFNRKQLFIRDASPANWLELGQELRDAAEELSRANSDSLRLEANLDGKQHLTDYDIKPGMSRPYLLLAGFAIENVLKGILVAADPSHISTGLLSNGLKTHNLLALASKIPSLVLSPDEQQFCDVATKAIPYWGRYPTPLRSSDVTPETGITKALRAAFLGLFDRLARDLYRKVRDGWDSGAGPLTLQVRNARYEEINLGESLIKK
jgi:hypothetical protein